MLIVSISSIRIVSVSCAETPVKHNIITHIKIEINLFIFKYNVFKFDANLPHNFAEILNYNLSSHF